MAQARNPHIELFNLPDKKSVEKFCRDIVVTKSELSAVLFAARLGDLGPYLHAYHFDQHVPEHLIPTEDDNGAMLAETDDARGNKFVRKVSQLFRDRRVCEIRQSLFERQISVCGPRPFLFCPCSR